MHEFVERNKKKSLLEHMRIFPAVAILGPRQCGKSTLIRMISENLPNFLYLDLQNRIDRARLQEPEFFFQSNDENIICLDEVQEIPEIFPVLRSEIDRNRRKGRFILLGSASSELIQKNSESLAGRIAFLELTPFLFDELKSLPATTLQDYWFRGGYPDSFLADSDKASVLWRENFIRTYVERDIPQFGFNIQSRQLQRMLMMTAHNNAQLFNASKLAEALGVTHPTVKKYLDIFEQTFILRSLQPFEKNTKKRLIKSPKVFVRDSGILHQLLNIPDFNALLGHPVFGSSWEGMVVENVCSSVTGAQCSFYRSAGGDELDLIIEKSGKTVAIECKASPAPQLTKGFWRSIEFVNPDYCFIAAPVAAPYNIQENVEVCNLADLIEKVRNILSRDQ